MTLKQLCRLLVWIGLTSTTLTAQTSLRLWA